MRKSSVRTLRQENNARERALSRESQREMADVVVYLRGQDLSPLDQEEIRRDILEMVWEAEARGETMAQVVGQDYRTFCQAIVAAVPRRPRRVRMAAAVEELLPALSVLLGIWLVKKVVEALLRGEAVMHLTLTLGEAISMGVLLAASVGIVTYLCRTALEGERTIPGKRVFHGLGILCGPAGGDLFAHFLADEPAADTLASCGCGRGHPAAAGPWGTCQMDGKMI